MKFSLYPLFAILLILIFACSSPPSTENESVEEGSEASAPSDLSDSDQPEADEPEAVPPEAFSSDNEQFNRFMEGFQPVSAMEMTLDENTYDTTRRIDPELARIFVPGNMTAYFAGNQVVVSEGIVGVTVHYYYRYVPEAAWMEGSYYEGSHILYFNADGNLTGELTEAYLNEDGSNEMGSVLKKTTTAINWAESFEKTAYEKQVMEADEEGNALEYEEYEWVSYYELGSESEINPTMEKLWSYRSHEINAGNREKIAAALSDLKDLRFLRVRMENGEEHVINNDCVAASNLHILESREDPDNNFGTGIDAWYYPLMVDDNDEYGTSLITSAGKSEDNQQIRIEYISMERYREDLPVVDMNQKRHELVFTKSGEGHWWTGPDEESFLMEATAATKLPETDYSCNQ